MGALHTHTHVLFFTAAPGAPPQEDSTPASSPQASAAPSVPYERRPPLPTTPRSLARHRPASGKALTCRTPAPTAPLPATPPGRGLVATSRRCAGSKFSPARLPAPSPRPAPPPLVVRVALLPLRRLLASAARQAAMANVADTKLYDILGVPPGASENELKKVLERAGRPAGGRGESAGPARSGRPEPG